MMYNCQLCVDEGGDGAQQLMQFPSLDQLEAHLAADHFGVLPYECEQCQFAKFPTEFAVIKHNEVDHGNRSYSFRCRITPEVKAKRRKVREFLLGITMDDAKTANGQPSHCVVRSQQQNVALLGRGGKCQLLQQQQTNVSAASVSNKFVAAPAAMGQSVGQNGTLSTATNASTQPFTIIKKEIVDLDEVPTEGRKERNTKDGTKQTNDQSQSAENGGGIGQSIDADRNNAIAEQPLTSLTEQIQAACLQKIRREGNVAVGNGALRAAYGGTLEIREGAELSPAALMNNATVGDGSADDGLIDEMDGQQADVQEILKAAAAAVSQVGGGSHTQPHSGAAYGRRAELSANGGYSLRPNRFSPYALLHQGLSTSQYQIGMDSNGTLKSFPTYHAELKREKVIDRIQCRKCKEMINAQGGCLNHHTNTRHLRLPMFQCTLCNKDFFEVSNTRIHKHMRLHHGGDTKHLVSNYHKYSAALHAARDEYFGRKEERIYAMRNPSTVAQKMDFNPPSAKAGETFSRLRRAPVTDPCATVRAVLRNHREQCSTKNGNRMIRDEVNGASSSSLPTRQNQQQCRKTEVLDNVEPKEQCDANGAEMGGDEIVTLKGGVEEQTAPEPSGSSAYAMDGMPMKEESDGYQHQMESMMEHDNEEDEPMEGEEELDDEDDDEEGAAGCADEDGPVHPMLAMMDAFKEDNDLDERQMHIQKGAAGRIMDSTKPKHFVRAGEAVAASSSLIQRTASGVRVVVQSNHSRAMRPSSVAAQHQIHQRHISYVGTDEKVPCKLCGEMVWNKITNRLNHINVRHLQLPLHECAICHKSFASYSRSACYSHVQFAHKTEIESGQCSSVIEEHIIYRKDCYNNQLMEAARDYF